MRVKGFPGRLLEQRIEVIDTSYICFVNMLKIFGFGKLVDNRGRDDAFKLILGCGSFQATVVMLSAKALIISLTHEVRRITTKEVKSHDFASFVKRSSFFTIPLAFAGFVRYNWGRTIKGDLPWNIRLISAAEAFCRSPTEAACR